MRFFSSERKRLRFWVLPISGLAIAAACFWKVSQPESSQPTSDAAGNVLRQAVPFSAHDSRKPPRLVRLASYLGRHRILLAFFDGTQPFDRDPTLQKLADQFDALNSQGIQVFALSAALPQVNRERLKTIDPEKTRWLFPILSDPTLATQRLYGRIEQTSTPQEQATVQERSGLFLIDRAGRLPYRNGQPIPLAEPLKMIAALASGSDDGL